MSVGLEPHVRKQKVTLYDSSGNEIEAILDNSGKYYLGASIRQSIIESVVNTSEDNLVAGDTFVGVGEKAYGNVGIQIYLISDKDTILYIEQGRDGITYDVSDTFECLANHPCTEAVYSVAPYFRIRVKNISAEDTTRFIVSAAMTPFILPLPRTLTDDDRVKTESTITSRDIPERHAWISPTNALSVTDTVRLIGTNFDGTVKDPNFWTETPAGSGSVTQDGEVRLSTGTTADSSIKYQTVRRARFVAGSALKLQSISSFVTTGTTNNIRRVGAYDTTSGFFYQLDGSTFQVGTRLNSTDTVISSGDFNGSYGPTYVDDLQYHRYEIEWSAKSVFFIIDGKVLHIIEEGNLTNTLSSSATMENINSGGLATDVVLDVISISVVREGQLNTSSIYKYLGTNATTVCKYGAGILHRIVNLDNAGTITVYDNTTTDANMIAVVDTAKALGTLEFGAPFSNGLRVVVAGNARITVVYE